MTGKEFLSSNKKKSSSGFWIRFSLLIFFFITVSAGVGLAYFYKFSAGAENLAKYKETQLYIETHPVENTKEAKIIEKLKNFKVFKQGGKLNGGDASRYYESQYKSIARESISLSLNTIIVLLVVTIIAVTLKRKIAFAKK